MQIGRITGLPEPQGFSQPDMSTVSFGLLASGTQAKQLLDLGSNGAERFVPIIFGTALAANDGVYELLDVGVEGDPNLEAAGLRQVSVSARCENQGRQVANSQLLVRGDNRDRTAAVGVSGPLYRVAVPDPPSTVTSFNAGPARFDVGGLALPTLRGDVRRITDRTQVKGAVARATTGNIALTGTVSVDGANAANGVRVLVKDQTTKSENGIYVVNTGGAWARSLDADGGSELDFAQVAVGAGTVNAGTTWFNPNQITIGTTAYDWQLAPAFGLRESDRGGPVSISYGLALANWYNGACTIEQGGTVVTGTRLAATGTVTIDNGLVRLVDSDFSMASDSPLAYGLPYGVAISGYGYSDPAVLANTPDYVSVRYRFSHPNSNGSVDFSLIRGSRTMTVAVSFDRPNYASVSAANGSDGFNALTAPTAVVAGAPGYASTGLDHLVYATANDADGNRVGLSYAGEIDEPLVAGVYTSATEQLSHLFGVHAVVGGGATLGGFDQLYGMDRAWFAMIAQQTSAGVL